jgi:hypothetical protein
LPERDTKCCSGVLHCGWRAHKKAPGKLNAPWGPRTVGCFALNPFQRSVTWLQATAAARAPNEAAFLAGLACAQVARELEQPWQTTARRFTPAEQAGRPGSPNTVCKVAGGRREHSALLSLLPNRVLFMACRGVPLHVDCKEFITALMVQCANQVHCSMHHTFPSLMVPWPGVSSSHGAAAVQQSLWKIHSCLCRKCR